MPYRISEKESKARILYKAVRDASAQFRAMSAMIDATPQLVAALNRVCKEASYTGAMIRDWATTREENHD